MLTLIAMTYGILGKVVALTRYPKQMRENLKKFDVQRATASWTKMSDLRHTLNEFEDVRRNVRRRPLRRDSAFLTAICGRW